MSSHNTLTAKLEKMDVVFAFYAFCILFLSTSDCFAMPRNPVGTNNDDCHYRRWTKCEGLPKYITSIKPTVKKTGKY